MAKVKGSFFFCGIVPGAALGSDQVAEERVQAEGGARSGETVGQNGLTKFGIEPQGGSFDISRDSGGAES